MTLLAVKVVSGTGAQGRVAAAGRITERAVANGRVELPTVSVERDITDGGEGTSSVVKRQCSIGRALT